MDFSANKTLTELINEGAFGGAYFRYIYSNVTGKWHKKPWKQFNQLKILIRSIIIQVITMLVLINILLNAEHR